MSLKALSKKLEAVASIFLDKYLSTFVIYVVFPSSPPVFIERIVSLDNSSINV